jgi:CRISPR-associated protein Cmr2
MSFDYYASLAKNKECPGGVNEGSNLTGMGDGCLVWSCQGNKEKNNARQCYMKRAAQLEIAFPEGISFDPDFSNLPDSSWFALDISFTLKSPWYSKDDRPFHVLDNPVRKDRAFGVPYMSAASWKGLLRWACRMGEGLAGHLESHEMQMDGWKDPPWMIHLFGNQKREDEHFCSGALVFYPTWFHKVGFEVINPHNRACRAGTQPIYYEVVPAGTEGRLRLLYAPLPGQMENDRINPAGFLPQLFDGMKALLETYGISAKRTAGWGTARIECLSLFVMTESWLDGKGPSQEYIPPSADFKNLLNEQGYPIDILKDENCEVISKTKFRKLGEKPCNNAKFEEFSEWYRGHGKNYRMTLRSGVEQQTRSVQEIRSNTLDDLRKKMEDSWKPARKGGSQ